MGHPGTPILYDPSKPVAEGGLCFRARFGVERDGDNLLAEGSYPVGSEIQDGYPEFTMAMLKKLGWDGDLTDDEKSPPSRRVAGDKTNWKTDLSGGIQRVAIKHGCAPFGNAKARCVVWNFPDPVPLHREPLYTRGAILCRTTIRPTRIVRCTVCRPTTNRSRRTGFLERDFPIILTSGRLVEYEGGGDETRSNPWLAELQQDMFVEINPFDANGPRHQGRRTGLGAWSPKRLQGQGHGHGDRTGRARRVAFMPFHFGGHMQGEDLRDNYPSWRRSLCPGRSLQHRCA